MLGGDDAAAVAILVIVAGIMMIVFGFAVEVSINSAKGATVVGWAMFGVARWPGC